MSINNLYLTKICIDKKRFLSKRSFDFSYPYSIQEDHGFINTFYKKTCGDNKNRYLWYVKSVQATKIYVLLTTCKPTQSQSFQNLFTYQSKQINDQFLSYKTYRFFSQVNPTWRDPYSHKIKAITDYGEIKAWLERQLNCYNCKLTNSFFNISSVKALKFRHSNSICGQKIFSDICINSCIVEGVLESDSIESLRTLLKTGIGRAKAFGFGLVQIVPVIN